VVDLNIDEGNDNHENAAADREGEVDDEIELEILAPLGDLNIDHLQFSSDSGFQT